MGLTERGDDRDAGDQNQRQHDGALHRRGAVFAGQQLAKVRDDVIHGIALAQRDVKGRSVALIDDCTLLTSGSGRGD